LQALLCLPSVGRTFNVGMISEYLADSLISRDETFFLDCFRLPAATTMEVGSSRKSILGYWTPAGMDELHLRTEDEYVEHLAELLAKATARRARTVSKIGVLLSGGLDSSAAACFALSATQTGPVASFGIETFSLIFPGMPCDESPAIESFLLRTGMKGHKIDACQPNLEGWSRNLRQFKDFPDSPIGAAYYPLFSLASKSGCKVMLGGWGSDDWLGGGPGIYADLLSHGGIRAIKHRFLHDVKQRGLGNAFWLMFDNGVRPVLRRGILDATGLRQLPFRSGKSSSPLWLSRAMAEVFLARRKLAAAKEVPKIASYRKAGQLRWLNSGMFAVNAEIQERTCAWNAI